MANKLEELFELPEERLATTDQAGKRVYLYPADVRGYFKKIRSWLHTVLILIFLGLPWVEINEHPAVLFDVVDKKFAIFGLVFWAHDAPMLFFVFGSIAFSIALVTTIWGRIWCGWACPETVFTESVFRKIERFVEGNANQRRKLDGGPWNTKKISKKVTKWFLFWLVAMVISHSFIAYFVGADRLSNYVGGSIEAHPTVFGFAFFITLIILFAFGWFREQFCVIVCPYGRMQSFLLDDKSLTVVYDQKRGEPRRGTVTADKTGDCVNCYRCVQVCPTGIDIRRGLQMECITCTACIDACDEVMTKIKKPKGLIRYDSQSFTGLHYFRSRTFIYSFVLVVLLSGLTFTVATKDNVDVKFLRAKDTPYQLLQQKADTIVINHFKLAIANNYFEPIYVSIQSLDDPLEIVTHIQEFTVNPGEKKDLQLFVKFSKSILTRGVKSSNVKVQIKHKGKILERLKELRLVGPY